MDALAVMEIEPETPDAYTVRFERPEDARWRYLPGQYVAVWHRVGGEFVPRHFSLSSSPVLDPFLQITIKARPDGQVSARLRRVLRPGDPLHVSPPEGMFTVSPDPSVVREIVLIAAGSGITPLWSMLRTVMAVEPHSRVTLFYGNRTPADIIYRRAIDHLVALHPDRLRVVHVLSQSGPEWPGLRGRLDRHRVRELVEALDAPPPIPPRDTPRPETTIPRTFFLCGPPGMMADARVALGELGIGPDAIRQESFAADPTPPPAPSSS